MEENKVVLFQNKLEDFKQKFEAQNNMLQTKCNELLEEDKSEILDQNKAVREENRFLCNKVAELEEQTKYLTKKVTELEEQTNYLSKQVTELNEFRKEFEEELKQSTALRKVRDLVLLLPNTPVQLGPSMARCPLKSRAKITISQQPQTKTFS